MLMIDGELCVYRIKEETPRVFLPEDIDPQILEKIFKYTTCPHGVCIVSKTRLEPCSFPHPSDCRINRLNDFCDKPWAWRNPQANPH